MKHICTCAVLVRSCPGACCGLGSLSSVAPEQGPQSLHLICEVALPCSWEEMAQSITHLHPECRVLNTLVFGGILTSSAAALWEQGQAAFLLGWLQDTVVALPTISPGWWGNILKMNGLARRQGGKQC